jgi:hypothetical protein
LTSGKLLYFVLEGLAIIRIPLTRKIYMRDERFITTSVLSALFCSISATDLSRKGTGLQCGPKLKASTVSSC